MSDPLLAIQKAFFDALVNATTAGAAVYDVPPPADAFPRITIGPGQSVGVFADCYDGSESTVQVDVWTREPPGFPLAKQIASEVRAILHDADLDLEGHQLGLVAFESATALRDADGLTSHVVMQFRVLSHAVSEVVVPLGLAGELSS